MDIEQHFAKSYELGHEMRELERCVFGCDYGATSWTTRREAKQIAELLGLRPGMRLLDVGAGSGWPGLFLAHLTGCNAVLADIPFTGLQIAVKRAKADGLERRCLAVAADGAVLPFKGGSFDALSHSDVLCCTPAKLALLQECRRVGRAGARMVFSVIAPVPCLSEAEHRLALEAGPPFVDAPADYALLLRDSGWRMLKRLDVTAEYEQSVRTLLREMEARADALTEALGSDEFSERVQRRRTTIAAIDRGLLKREIFVALASEYG